MFQVFKKGQKGHPIGAPPKKNHPRKILYSTIIPLFSHYFSSLPMGLWSLQLDGVTNFGQTWTPLCAGADKHGRNSRRTWELLWDHCGKQPNLERTDSIGISSRKVAMDPNGSKCSISTALSNTSGLDRIGKNETRWNKYRSIDVTWKELENKQHKFK